MENYIYFHICCINNWKEIVSSLLEKIKYSGLYDNIKEIRCGVLGIYDDNQIFNDPKIKIIIQSDNIDIKENFTINKLYEDSKNENFNVLYIHSKGVRHNNGNINVIDWVNYMSYFNINCYKYCVELLNNYDTVGVNLQDNPSIHYSGNFWWSKTTYIRKLETCNDNPEMWLTGKKIGKYVSLWNTEINHYLERYLPDNYVNKDVYAKVNNFEEIRLIDLIDNSLTDKHRDHSYLKLYETLLSSKKETAKNILEIGIGDFNEKNGGSLKLWRDYFKNAHIYGADILPIHRVIDELRSDKRITLHTSIDAYDKFYSNKLKEVGIKFDMILDDGPHNLDSWVKCIKQFSDLLTDDGILMIEDIGDWEYIEILNFVVPENLKKYVKAYDLRSNRNIHNDIVFTIDKRL